jgi:hypothetical protein
MVSMIERLEERHGTQEAKVIERLEGHYEVQEVPFGQVYRWCPGRLVLECECGEELILNSSMATCLATCHRCGADHTTEVFREELSAGWLGDEALHPWRYARDREDTGLPY